MFSFLPVKKLSRQMTSSPRSTRRSQRWLPRKPAPPVTSTVAMEKSVSFLEPQKKGLPRKMAVWAKIRRQARHLEDGTRISALHRSFSNRVEYQRDASASKCKNAVNSLAGASCWYGQVSPRRRREENAVLTPILDPAKIRPAWMRQIGFITRFPAGRQE